MVNTYVPTKELRILLAECKKLNIPINFFDLEVDAVAHRRRPYAPTAMVCITKRMSPLAMYHEITGTLSQVMSNIVYDELKQEF